jgi:hypothetical protein
MTEVPVIVIDGLTENQRRALILADNKLTMNAGWDEETLRLEIEALRDAEYDLDIIGFEDDELRLLFSQQEAAGGADWRGRCPLNTGNSGQRSRRSLADGRPSVDLRGLHAVRCCRPAAWEREADPACD